MTFNTISSCEYECSELRERILLLHCGDNHLNFRQTMLLILCVN